MVQKFSLNILPILFSENMTLNYRIWTIDPIPTTAILRQKIRDDLRWKHLYHPVGKTYFNDHFAFAVDESAYKKEIEYKSGQRVYKISPTDNIQTVYLSAPQKGETELASDLLYQAYCKHLNNDDSLLRGFTSGTYFAKTPDKSFQPRKSKKVNSPRADIYRGFSFRVEYFEEIGFCIALDAQTSYIGKDKLAELLASNAQLRDVEDYDGITRWVIDLGESMQGVYLISRQNKSISDITLPNGTTIYDFLISKYSNLNNTVSPNDEGVSYVYKSNDKDNEEKYYTTASTLMRPKLKLDSQAVRGLYDTPAFPADNRYSRIIEFRKHFYNLYFLDETIKVGRLSEVSSKVFEAPDLVYGNDSILKLNKTHQNPIQSMKNWGRKKLEFLEKHGPEYVKEFENLFIVYPANFESDDMIGLFVNKTANICKKFGKIEFNPTYSSYADNASAKDIINKLQGIVDNQRAGFIVLALPKNTSVANEIYVYLKTEVKVPSKCFVAETFKREVKRKKVDNYIQYNSLAMLQENEARLWGISGGLNYELHIGLDVARSKTQSLMGATTISNKTANNLQFYQQLLPMNKDRSLREVIPSDKIGRFTLQRLEDFFKINNRSPENILFHRDGRVHEEEVEGIQKAINRFTRNHDLDKEPSWVIVSLLKETSMNFRIFLKNGSKIESPLTGSYALQSEKTGFLVTSGAPALPQGTPKPIQVKIIDGNAEKVNIEDILKDVYWLTHLNWASPQITTNLPATIRFTDNKLERYIMSSDTEVEDEW